MALNGRVGQPEPAIAHSGFTLLLNINEGLLWLGARDSTLISQTWPLATGSHTSWSRRWEGSISALGITVKWEVCTVLLRRTGGLTGDLVRNLSWRRLH